MRPLITSACTLALASAVTLAAAAPGAQALESRLYAPCCYNGTLDIHDSELARDLRKEIETRLERGQSADDIQADFVVRYGEKVVAARSDRPIRDMGIAVVALLIAAGAGLIVLLRRWRRTDPDPEAATATRDELDDRVDAELANLDG